MDRPYQLIKVERTGDVFCARLCQRQLEEDEVHALAAELMRLIDEDGCRKLALALGPEPPQCLYSVFLTKLLSVQRHLHHEGGALVICDASPEVLSVFEACRLGDCFRFVPDQDAAVAALA